MKVFLTMIVFVIASFSVSEALSTDSYLYCQQLHNPTASEVRISFNEENLPSALALRSPGAENFRPMDVTINAIQENPKQGLLLFNSFPAQIPEIDWDSIENCYVEVGTQWHFTLNFKQNLYGVRFVPYFIQEYRTCYLPRFKPQFHELKCSDQSS